MDLCFKKILGIILPLSNEISHFLKGKFSSWVSTTTALLAARVRDGQRAKPAAQDRRRKLHVIESISRGDFRALSDS